MANTRLSAFFSLLLVFFSGAVVGIFSYRAYSSTTVAVVRPPAKKQNPEELRKQLIDEMTRDVNLDAGQVAKLGTIYDETRERFHTLRNDFNDKSHAIWDDQISQIKSFLRPDQVILYDKLRAKRDAERQANDRKQGGRHGGPGGPGIKKD